MPKITRTGGTGTTRPPAPEGISAADQSKIMKLISDELKKTGDSFTKLLKKGGPGPVMKYMVVAPGPGPVMKYMVVGPGPGPTMKYMVQPPGNGGGGAVPLYLAPGPTMKYMVQPPGNGGGGAVPLYLAPGPTMKYMVQPPMPGPGGGGAVPLYLAPSPGPTMKYMVHPPGGGGGSIIPMYMAVPPGLVAKYMVVPPWAGLNAHQAVINKVIKDGKLVKTEAQLVRKLFNRDIAEAKKDGKDISAKVASYLHKTLDKLSGDKATKDLIFGLGGPGYTRPTPIAKYMVVRPS